MGIDCKQLRDQIIVPSLVMLEMLSNSAVNLLLGTAAQESHMGTYIKQITGPACGIYQVEPGTFFYCWSNTPLALKRRIMLFLNYSKEPVASMMTYDLRLATIMCRLKYYSIKEKLPDNTPPELAVYWKKYYNTPLGKGTELEFVTNYGKYVTC